MAFYVGQKVVCVDATPDPFGRVLQVTKGSVYTVASVFDWRGATGLTFVEIECHNAPGWYARRFRPITERKTDISIFKAMLNPSKQEVTA